MSANQLPATIGPYQVLDVLGHGGMAIVYRACQRDLDRLVAIKLLRPPFADDPVFRQRFQREARLVARLRHPNIVTIHGVGEEAGQPYLVMEFLPGPTLQAVLAQRRHAHQVFAPTEALALLRPLAAALEYAHAQHIIHRDLKPGNIVLTPHGPVLTDFGLAKLVEGTAATVSLVIGTPAYMAPEQIEGWPVDRRTDVYALGILLYVLLTGQQPFTGSTPAAVTQGHLHQPAPPLVSLHHDLARWPALEAVVQRAVAKRQADRWPTVAALVDAVAQAVDAPTVRTRPVPVPHPPVPRPGPVQPAAASSSRAGRLLVLLPLLLLLLGGLWGAWRLAPRTSPFVAGEQATREGTTGRVAAPPEAGPTAGTADTPTAPSTDEVVGEGLPPPSPPPRPAPTPTGQTAAAPTRAGPTASPDRTVRGVITAPDGAYLRSGPGTTYPIVAGLPDTTPVTALGQAPGWLAVATASGAQGWVASSLVAIQAGEIAALPAPAVAPPPPVPVQPTTTSPSPPVPPPTTRPRPAATPSPPQQAAVAPSPPQQAAAAGTRVRLEDTAFTGGWRNGGASIYGGRTATWVYGQGSGYSTMRATLTLNAPARGTATVTIVGMDSEDSTKTPLRITVNGVTLFQGPDPLPNDDPPLATGQWGTLTFRVDAARLHAGGNTLSLANLARGPINRPPFIALDYAVVQLP